MAPRSHPAAGSRQSDPLKYSTPEFQQSVLTLVRRTFSAIYSDPETLATTIQTVKTHLFARDYAAAFSSPDYLFAYVVRWSPSRALAYLHIFGDLCPQIRELLGAESRRRKNILCVGGGAGGEVLALAMLGHDLGANNVNIYGVDIAHWDVVFARLRDGLRRELGWDKDGQEIVNDDIQLEFHQMDILDAPCYLEATDRATTSDKSSKSAITADDQINFSLLSLITVLFTTNELFAQSKARTMTLLEHISENCKAGTLLLIVESAGSYSHIQIGTKTFPVQFLLDHTLVDGAKRWEKVVDDDSVWFRLDEKLKYPLQLENMRFFLRLYRKL